MDTKLLDISTEELLRKFGAGNHKPGSGSAAAFQGMISAKLLVTVISLTNEEKRRPNYAGCLPKLLDMNAAIEDRIFPELTKLFCEDAVQFDKTIKSRQARDLEKNPVKKARLARQALGDLKIAVEIPLSIASLSVELAQIAGFVFDNAFKTARGDSQVALSGAVAALGGCLSIVQLNLLSFGSDEYDWIENARSQSSQLKSHFGELSLIAASKIEALESEVDKKAHLYKDVNMLLKQSKSNKKMSNADVENYATQLQRLVWKHRDKIWSKNAPTNPLQILIPDVLFKKVLGYDYLYSNELGLNGNQTEMSEVAGIIDQQKKLVLISNDFSPQVMAFTAAHELGHAILHNQSVLHRDIPVDGGESKGRRNPQELQADKFASYFLMPRKQINEIFQTFFLTDKFVIDESNAFNLIQGSPSQLKAECRSLRGLSRKLAKAEYFAGITFKSLADVFNVSVEAMAIRLEELGLVEY
ncbi:Formiminotetrahydrofolate cyclodeaminase [bacterium A37T11]|nr:Formiminotetrahydrofolate cyclodeaminase [bacterium A37T11]